MRSLSKIRIIQGDALALDSHLLPESVDLIVTSPPYFAMRKHLDDGVPINVVGDEVSPQMYLRTLQAVMRQFHKVLKPTGSVFVVINDKSAGSGGHNNAGISRPTQSSGDTTLIPRRSAPYRYNQSSQVMTSVIVKNKSLLGIPWRFANHAVEAGWILRSDIVWSKSSVMPDNARDRVQRSHEYIFHFTKSPAYYSVNGVNQMWSVWQINNPGLSIPNSVLEKHGADKHYSAFPPEIPRRIIEGWCPPDGIVLDPFGGAGTTALVSRVLNRNCVSIDISSGYVRLARWRVYASDHYRKLRDKWQAENPSIGTVAQLPPGEPD